MRRPVALTVRAMFVEQDAAAFQRLEALRARRYHSRAKAELRASLQQRGALDYERTVLDALQWPMTAESDVRDWVKDSKAAGDVAIDGLKGKERTPQRKRGHRLRWTR